MRSAPSSSVPSDLASLCRISAEAPRIAANIAKLPELLPEELSPLVREGMGEAAHGRRGAWCGVIVVGQPDGFDRARTGRT